MYLQFISSSYAFAPVFILLKMCFFVIYIIAWRLIMDKADWITLVHDTCRRVHIVHGGLDDETSIISALGHLQGAWSCGAVHVCEPQHLKDVLSRHAEIVRINKRFLVSVSADLVSQLPDVYNDICALRNVTVVLRVRAGGVVGSPYSKSSRISVLILPSVQLENSSVVSRVRNVYRCPLDTDPNLATHGTGYAWTVGASTVSSLVHYNRGLVRNTFQDIVDALFWWNAALFRCEAFLHPATDDKRFMLRFLALDTSDFFLKQIESEIFQWFEAASQLEVDGSIVVKTNLRSLTLADWAAYCTVQPQKDVFVVHVNGSIQACTIRTNGAVATASELGSGIAVKLFLFPSQLHSEKQPESTAKSVKWKVFVPAAALKV